MTETQRLQAAVKALEDQRAALGDEVVSLALAPIHERLRNLSGDLANDFSYEAKPRLRQVSVLFLDVVDSTATLAGLDPEDAMAVLGAALQRFGTCVQAQAGRVLRYTGDGLKVAFGVDQAREDDAERAVRCGLALPHARRHRAPAFFDRPGHPPRHRGRSGIMGYLISNLISKLSGCHQLRPHPQVAALRQALEAARSRSDKCTAMLRYSSVHSTGSAWARASNSTFDSKLSSDWQSA